MTARFRYGALLGLTLGLSLFGLLVGDSRGARSAELLTAGAVLMTAVLTSGAPVRTRRAAVAVVGLAATGVAIAELVGTPPPALVYGSSAFLVGSTILVLVGGLARLVLDRGVVVTAVFGALTVYLLAGMMFAFLIGAIATGGDGNYFAQGTDGTQADRVYFSFTALTTTGFGDLTAATRVGHALVVMEMLIGQLYLVTVIATLVGNLRRRPEGEPSRLRDALGMPSPVNQPGDQADG
jgi:hypothetical protein